MNPDPTSTFNISIGNNPGNVFAGHGNVISVSVPSLGGLGLGAAETSRIEAALQALRDGRDDSDDAKALKAAAQERDEKTRAEKIKSWLLKIAPHAAALAGTIVNPVVGEVAKAATEWAARALGNKP